MPHLTAADGAEIAYAVAGSGPAVFLLPGMASPGATLGRVLTTPLVAAGHTVITIDPRDTGASTRYDGTRIDLVAVLDGDFATVPYTYADMAGDALAVLDAVGIASATWVGYSMGGSVLAAIQARAPERVDALVYFASGPGFGRAATPEDLAHVLRAPPADRNEAVAWSIDFAEYTWGRHFDPERDTPTAELFVDEMGFWGVPMGHISAGLVGNPGVTTITPDERRTTVVFADEDPGASGWRAFAATMPDATVVELGAWGHWFPDRGPWPKVIAAIIDAAPT
ncbi:alpha/beta fold hydrolase [Aquihabitans sp. McL0605]|uniref:alpha/beta fold hydrolase n=1 Tax=Aquihabitans sp. McL0605 TaxID=3415671 RepID=UPI003CF7A980